jgi:hypothetical protein
MTKRTTVTDEIYHAAIETAGHLGSPVEASAAVRALAYELELRGLTVTLSPEGDSTATADILLVDGSDGVCITAASDAAGERDMGDLLRRHQWHHAHEIVFGAGSLHIKSIAA